MTDQSSHSTDYDGVGHAATDARSGMTKTERAELVRIVRLNYKVARATVDQRQADVLADVEEQIATDWESHDKQWREACGETEDDIRDLNQRIRERFQELACLVRTRHRCGCITVKAARTAIVAVVRSCVE